MSAQPEKKYTACDLTFGKRDAFVAGAKMVFQDYKRTTGREYPGDRNSPNLFEEAMRLYPVPMVTRPRVVEDPTSMKGLREWRVCDGALQTRITPRATVSSMEQREWHGFHGAMPCEAPMDPTPARVAMWADLLANPTEEVEA